jgi:hypothetical protein
VAPRQFLPITRTITTNYHISHLPISTTITTRASITCNTLALPPLFTLYNSTLLQQQRLPR